MAININTNFKVGSKEYLDSKQSFKTILEMKDYNENLIPDGFITFNDEDKTNYQYLSSNEIDADTGRWRAINFGGADIIDDTLDTATVKTWSIDKIKEVISKMHEFVKVDVLPDLTDIDSIDLGKIYIVPAENGTGVNDFDEYYIEVSTGSPAIMRTPLVTDENDFNSYIAELTDYIINQSGTTSDDFTTYSGVVTTTTMTEEIYNEMLGSYNLTEDFTTYTARIEAIELTPATQDSYKWEKLCSLNGSVNLVYEEDIIVNNPQGKIIKDTNLNGMSILDVVAGMLQKDEAPTITLTGEPTTNSLYELGVATITDVNLDIKINLGTGKINTGENISIKRNGVEVNTIPFVDGQLNYTFTDTGVNIADDTTYIVEVKYLLNNVEASVPAKAELKYNFAYPIFYGVSATKTIADITSLTKKIDENKDQTLAYTANNAYCVLAIPSTLTVTKVLDQNGFDNTGDFSSVQVSVTLGTNNVVYNVYTNSSPVTCTNFKYNFLLG